MTPTLEHLLAVGLRNCIVLYYFLVVAAIQSHNFMRGRRVHVHRRADEDGVYKGRDLKCMWGVVDAVDTEAVVQ